MFRTVLWVLGGMFCAMGVLNLFFAFHTPFGGGMSVTISAVGWDGVAHVTPTDNFPFALLGVALGLPILVGLNASAWKLTGGY
jgi:hypothetical protein